MSPEPITARLRPGFLLAALGVWAAATFGHGMGQRWARDLFRWAQTPGNLHAEGGGAGTRLLELGLTLGFGALALGVLARVLWGLRGLDRDRWLECGVPWLLWALLVHLTWKCCVIYATELVHFAQYALIAFLLARGLGGCRPQAAFLLATGLGALDEIWQHYGLAAWLGGNHMHGLDWSDLILNGLGSCGGVLVLSTSARARRLDLVPSTRLLYRAVGGVALVLGPFLLLDPETWSWIFGYYWYHPFWMELENDKAVHWLTPGEGIPLTIAALLVLGLIVEPRRHTVLLGILAALVFLTNVAIAPPTRQEGRVLHEVVPHARVHRIPPGGIRVDGRLDELHWQEAERLGPFLTTRTASPELVLENGERIPLQGTHARLLWDERALYVAFEVADDDVWGRETHRDDPRLPGDDVVEIFVDPGGDEINYYEIEVSATNVVYDLFCYVPGPPMDYNPWSMSKGLAGWDARGLESAVHVDGEIDVVENWSEVARWGGDQGWSVEIAIPWENFRTTTTPQSNITIGALPPRIGEQWRVGLYRVDWARAAGPGEPAYSKDDLNRRSQYQAWSPTYNASFHHPPRFGVVEFVERP